MDARLKDVIVAERKYDLKKYSSFSELKKMTGAEMCFNPEEPFNELQELEEAKLLEQGSINDTFVMGNKSLALVDASAVGDVINYTFVEKDAFQKKLEGGGFVLNRNAAGDEYGVESHEDSNGTIFQVWIPNGYNLEEQKLEEILKDHLDGIKTSLTNGVRIGKLVSDITSVPASMLVEMPEVNAMNKDTFLNIVNELGDKYKKSRAFLDKGNMIKIAQANKAAVVAKLFNAPAMVALATATGPAVQTP
eukprot:GHVS01082885.1.p1 GENE.GHVS01082885.1~~GHVS01082885.1.p1  ORF type:complete len:264 (-),score=23.89 GHVS01082885.1:144-890(-)